MVKRAIKLVFLVMRRRARSALVPYTTLFRSAKTVPRMGNVVTDGKGRVLYRFDKDKASPSKTNCVGDCAKLWPPLLADDTLELDRKSTRLNSSHVEISYAVFCLKKKNT